MHTNFGFRTLADLTPRAAHQGMIGDQARALLELASLSRGAEACRHRSRANALLLAMQAKAPAHPTEGSR